ncbi:MULTISPECIES: alcohol dehydrogenase catalytic domain-containing protein [Mycobacteriaceae]|jgi:NADPH:quinone reductase-like Zn-dependent oxidoreductase|uniref:Enoyl reductase (ER) domain-containing protein n=1 Tax=Mycolicibacterium tusciae TaxID=75922 RepID=A0A1X0JCL5_9MYCO|nr:zinc-binding dehydrogenase [Mycolicibacterium tusciae]MBE5472683.1 hypothetical protein [Mycobacteroides abscessus]ORB60669.1 hypothetical protein BST47_29580 [Mycolicibacterium tusciae]
MTATRVVIRQHGGADTLVAQQIPLPCPAAGEVLIEVEAAGVAYADVLMRRGIYPETPRLPFTPGYDVVGRVLEVGSAVATLQPGDRVAALTVTGGYSTHVLATTDLTVPVPEELAAAEVTALVLNYVTAYQLLNRVAQVTPGAAVLVYGAAGGVGTALLELAAIQGIRAIGIASGQRTEAISARQARAIDRCRGDVVAQVLQHEPAGVSATFDPVGGPHLRSSRRVTAPKGIVVSYGMSFAVDNGLGRLPALLRHAFALARAKTTPGPSVRLYVIAGRRGKATRRPDHFRADLSHLIGLLQRGDLAPEVTALPLTHAADAHRALEAGAVTGKLILTPQGP